MFLLYFKIIKSKKELQKKHSFAKYCFISELILKNANLPTQNNFGQR